MLTAAPAFLTHAAPGSFSVFQPCSPDRTEHGGGRGGRRAPGISDLAVILSASQEDHGSVAGKAPGARSPRVS